MNYKELYDNLTYGEIQEAREPSQEIAGMAISEFSFNTTLAIVYATGKKDALASATNTDKGNETR